MGLVVFSLFMHVMVLAFVPPDQIRIVLEQTAQSLRRRFRAKESPPPLPAAAKEPLVLNRT
jgi:hypothetical protein